jgi:hypothetical protein
MAVASPNRLPVRPGVWDPTTTPHTDGTGRRHLYARDQVMRVITLGEGFAADHGIRPENFRTATQC